MIDFLEHPETLDNLLGDCQAARETPEQLERRLVDEYEREKAEYERREKATWDYRQQKAFEEQYLPQVPDADAVYRFRGKDIHGWESNGIVWTKSEKWRDGTEHEKIMRIQGGTAYVKHFPASGLYKVVRMKDAAKGHVKADTDGVSDDVTKLRNNVVRARTTVEEYGLCNHFNLFATFTINGEKLDRLNLEDFRKKLVQLIKDTRKKGYEIQFLLVPELHKDGKSWHLHGLFQIPEEILTAYKFDIHLPRKIKERLKAGKKCYFWQKAQDAFGWNTFELIENQQKAVRYIMKYLAKEGAETAAALEKGQHLYYVSRGLKKAKKISAERLLENLPAACFSRYYETCTVEWYDTEIIQQEK